MNLNKTSHLRDSGAFKPDRKLYSPEKVILGMLGLMRYIIMDEATAVNGVLWLVDFGQCTMKHQLWWGMDHMKKTMKVWQVGRMVNNINTCYIVFLLLF